MVSSGHHSPTVNFFGHALAASWRGREPAFALGAMLPDFAGMCGMRLDAALDAETAAGVDYHHATDRVFHMLEPFARATAGIAEQLMARGVPRGPARGAAHVGFELCLDGALLEQEGAARAYETALAAGSDSVGGGVAALERARRARALAVAARQAGRARHAVRVRRSGARGGASRARAEPPAAARARMRRRPRSSRARCRASRRVCSGRRRPCWSSCAPRWARRSRRRVVDAAAIRRRAARARPGAGGRPGRAHR